MKVTVIAVGRVREPLRAAVEEYETRAGRYWKLERVEVDAGGPGGRAAQVMEAEGRRILARVPEGAELIALSRTGDALDSEALARLLERAALGSSPGIAFAIGGAFGLAADVLARTRRRLSLSALTLPHELARLVLAEQLYRAGTILRGEPYHKG